VENEWGKLEQPELFRPHRRLAAGDALLVEQVDRLLGLNATDWYGLRLAPAAPRCLWLSSTADHYAPDDDKKPAARGGR
jgi:hypothetical protein